MAHDPTRGGKTQNQGQAMYDHKDKCRLVLAFRGIPKECERGETGGSFFGRIGKEADPHAVELGQFWYNHSHKGHEIDDEVGEVVVGVMGTEEEEDDGDGQEELLGRGVLVSVVNLFPHVQIVVGAGVEFKRNTSNPVKHEVGTGHVCNVGQGPRDLLGHTGQNVKQDFEADY